MKKSTIILLLISTITLGITIYILYPEPQLSKNVIVDKIIVIKSQHQLILLAKNAPIKIYKIALGRGPINHKQFEGDNKTPEGIYTILRHGEHKLYHKYLYISYPNKTDRLNATKMKKNAGSGILIHGLHKNYSFLNKLHRWYDWTKGCIAVTNKEIDEIYNAVKIGTIIEIKP